MNVIAKLFSLCFIIIFLNSCREKDDDPEKANYIEAKVNGALWSPSSVSCVLLIDTVYNFRIVDFTASSSGKTITIEASDNSTGGAINTGTRTYSAGTAFFSYGSAGTPYHTISGSINITEIEASSLLASGTFDFTMEDNSGNFVNISGGRFVKVKYSIKHSKDIAVIAIK